MTDDRYSSDENIQHWLSDVESPQSEDDDDLEQGWTEAPTVPEPDALEGSVVEVVPQDEPTVALKPGSDGPNVVILQKMLDSGGYRRLEIDGFYGPQTRNGVAELQKALKAEGLFRGRVDGVFTEATIEALRAR